MTRPPLPPFQRFSDPDTVTLTDSDPVTDPGFSFHDFSFQDTRRLLLPPLSRRLLMRVENNAAIRLAGGK